MVFKKEIIQFQSDDDDELSVSLDEAHDSFDDRTCLNASDDDDGKLESFEDSDSSPEEVGFKIEKEKSKLLKKRTLEQIKAQKEQVKKKRTEMHIRNKKQKEHKITSRALPTEVLESLGNSAPVKSPPSIAAEKLPSTHFVGTSHSGEGSIAKPEQCKPQHEFISIHGSTVFRVKNLKKELKKPKPLPEVAGSFRDRILYGCKNRREKSTRAYFAKLEKQKSRGK